MQLSPTSLPPAFVTRWAVRSASIAVFIAAAIVPASAQTLEQIKEGSAIAAERCGKCHAVGVADASPHKITPPLRDLAKDFPIPMLNEALANGRVGGHDEMPMFELGKSGVEALLAYIDSLNPKGPNYIGATR